MTAFTVAIGAAFAQTKVTLNFQVGGKTRSTAIYVPSAATKPPVVFFIHGANGSGSNFENETKGDVIADREKFIAVYPSASSNGAAGVWDDMQGKGNFPFFLAILDTLDARYHIDRDRVYMTGFSQGGFISYAAACFYSDIFAAVAPVSGHTMKSCAIKRPVPVFMTFGAQEGTSFFDDLTYWNGLNKCPDTPASKGPYPSSKPTSKVGRITYGPCDKGTQVILDSISGQGHQWPGTNNINQADEVWTFFKTYSLATTTGIGSSHSIRKNAAFSVNYVAGQVFLKGMEGETQVQVTDAEGKEIATVMTSQHRFDFKGRPSGIYLATVEEKGRRRSEKFMVP